MKDKFVSPTPLTTPVLFLIFNRPDTTQKVFNAIRQAKPKQLFVAADGPREGKEGEKEKCEQARKIIEQVDWDCEVKTLFRDKNLGCKVAVSSAIDWFFENVEEGIILEDDCLPNQSFFWFCQELLTKYKADNRVGSINGCSVTDDDIKIEEDYFFCYFERIWGWATWRNIWKNFNVDIINWPKIKKEKIHYNFFHNTKQALFMEEVWDECYNNKIDTWDYQWLLFKLVNSYSAIVTKKNLVTNIGFSEDSTHTRDPNDGSANFLSHEIDFPLQHPAIFYINYKKDDYIFKKCYTKSLKNKVKGYIKNNLLNKFNKFLKIKAYVKRK